MTRVIFHPESYRWVLYALREIQIDEEITTDYLDRPYFAPPSYPQWDTSSANEDNDVYTEDSISMGFSETLARLFVIIAKWIILPSVILLL